LETKLTIRGSSEVDITAKLAPVEEEVRRRIGNFIIAEDDATLEGVVLATLAQRQGSLAIVETSTGGQISSRIAPLPGAETVFRRGTVARHLAEIYAALGIECPLPTGLLAPETAQVVAQAARHQARTSHALAVLVDIEDGADRIDLGGTICLAIATEREVVSRQSRLAGGREWVRLGAIEMGLDSLRRYLQGLPIQERIDFEKAEKS
jgi:nicotinamide-nucleotide amidase